MLLLRWTCSKGCSRAVLRRTGRRSRGFHASPVVARNRLLLEASELLDEGEELCALLQPGDARSTHLSEVLRPTSGRTLRVGVVNGPRADATVAGSAVDGWRLSWRKEDMQPALPTPAVDLLLALPRPKVMRRLWAPLSALGVGVVYVTNASRVERNYFDSHVAAGSVREQLLRGLEMAGDTRLPPILLSRRLPPVVDFARGVRSLEEAGLWPTPAWAEWLVDAELPAKPTVTLVAHPGAGDPGVGPALRAAGLSSLEGTRVLLAIGPEGGWTDHEIELLMSSSSPGHRSCMVSLGSRVLDTTTASIALLAALREAQGWT
jgi:16S rRNA (uracil1498-N3)-methyltransferase